MKRIEGPETFCINSVYFSLHKVKMPRTLDGTTDVLSYFGKHDVDLKKTCIYFVDRETKDEPPDVEHLLEVFFYAMEQKLPYFLIDCYERFYLYDLEYTEEFDALALFDKIKNDLFTYFFYEQANKINV